MSLRRAYLDACPGEVRAVVTLDGWPERLMIERTGVDRGPRLGARYRARLAERLDATGLAYLDLGHGEEAVLASRRGEGLAKGAVVEVEIAAEARRGKAAAARLIGPSAGAPGALAPGPSLEARLAASAPEAEVETGPAAREIADEAEAQVLAARHGLPDGLELWIEPTHALTAIDVDWSAAGPGSARRKFKANLAAIRHGARLLRLKAFGGAAVIDLLGFPKEGEALVQAAREALAPDQPGAAALTPSRLGLLQMVRPHRERPLREVLTDPDGRMSARSEAQKLVRALEREGAADPGGQFVALCEPDVAGELEPLARGLGPRFQASAGLGAVRGRTDIRRR